MSGFQVGDVVVKIKCGKDVSSHLVNRPILTGTVLRVEGVIPAPSGEWLALYFSDYETLHYTRGWNSIGFRKIRPASDEFITALRACKPERIGEPSNV